MSDPDPDDPMTPAQRQAIEKAWEILCEHFERVLVVVDFECESEQGTAQCAHEGYWHGGALAAIGMSRFAENRIMNSGQKESEP